MAYPYQWSSLIRVFFMPKCIISEYTTQNMYQLRYEIVTEWSQRSWSFCHIVLDNSRAERAKLFRLQHIGEHCPFKLNTSQHCSVEFGYLDNLPNGVVALDDTLLRLWDEQEAFRTNQEKTHLFFCTARVMWQYDVAVVLTRSPGGEFYSP